jgi:hypothetical protein
MFRMSHQGFPCGISLAIKLSGIDKASFFSQPDGFGLQAIEI